MMSNPLISIIVPVYDVEKYLDRCVESIVNQTYDNLEIILVDDGSPDNCPQMCDNWAKKDSRIRVIHIENKGVANARNKGIKIATGDYIGFVDSDDWIEPDMFEMLLEVILDSYADVSVCDYQINNENRGVDNIQMISQSDALKLICTGDYKYGVLWNKLYKRSVINDISMPELVCCEDLVFNYLVFKNVKKASECGYKLYHYFQNAESTVHNEFSIGAFDAVKSKEIMLEQEKGTELEQYAIRGLISSCFVVMSGIITSNKFIDKYDYLRSIILKNKSVIFTSDMYSKTDRIKTLILLISKKTFNKLVLKRNP